MNKYLFLGIVAIFIITVLLLDVEPALTILVIILCSVLATASFLPQRAIQQEIKAFVSLLVDGILLTVALICWFGWQDSSGTAGLIFFSFGTLSAMALIQRRFSKLVGPGSKRSTYSNLSQWYINPGDPDIRSAILRWKDDQIDNEFIFRGLGLPCQIPESRFTEFIKTARRRQTNAVYGTKWSMVSVGNGNFRQLKKNEILSAAYYTKRKYPRWPVDEYWACMMILGYTRLLQKKGQGDAGRLMGDKGCCWYVDEAKRRWLLLVGQMKPKPFLNRMLRRT